MAHEMTIRVFGMTRKATVRVERIEAESNDSGITIGPPSVKICINGQFGEFVGFLQLETAAQLAVDLMKAAVDAKG
jgi:hypothetical protein